jgi:hypothetical protein
LLIGAGYMIVNELAQSWRALGVKRHSRRRGLAGPNPTRRDPPLAETRDASSLQGSTRSSVMGKIIAVVGKTKELLAHRQRGHDVPRRPIFLKDKDFAHKRISMDKG